MFTEDKIMTVKAHEFLLNAAAVLKERGKTYDVNGTEERSINKTVDMFKALTGVQMKYEQGWLFMACLKMVRSQQNDKFHEDSFLDAAAYLALAGESSSEKVVNNA
jgi:hypothetical protein